MSNYRNGFIKAIAELAVVENTIGTYGDAAKYLVGILETSPIKEEMRLATTEHPPGSCVAVPVPMLLWCPGCGKRHVDSGLFETKVHDTHACQHCGMTWRPALCATVGVQFLPGFKNDG